MTLGEQTLNREEFERLAELGSPLVRLGDQWLELDPAQVQAARQFMDRNDSSGNMPLLQAVGLAQAFSRDRAGARAGVIGATTPFEPYRSGGLSGGRESSPLQDLVMTPEQSDDWDLEDGLAGPELPLEAVVADGWLGTASGEVTWD